MRNKLAFLFSIVFASFCLIGLMFFIKVSRVNAQLGMNNSLIWPISGTTDPDTGAVSSPFGPRWQASQERYDYHAGLDIVAPINTPVHVITDGVVTEVGWLSPDSGLTVIVSHTQAGYNSAYLHLNSAPVEAGQAVSQGDVIGYVGNSGTTEFMHLHFEIRLTDHDYPFNTRNPMGYLPRPEVTTPTIQIDLLTADPIFSPTVRLLITATRPELDVNVLRVILQDRATGQVIDDQSVNFDIRLHTGEDDLDQDGIQLTPSHFNTTTLEYELTAYYYQLVGMDAFTLTAQVTKTLTMGNTLNHFQHGFSVTKPQLDAIGIL